MKTGIELIAAERERQISKEGWTPEHDDGHTGWELALAAASYSALAGGINKRWVEDELWPSEWADCFKPKTGMSNLIRAGALIAAEIDRLNRLAKPTKG
jgi:hypothetical protein